MGRLWLLLFSVDTSGGLSELRSVGVDRDWLFSVLLLPQCCPGSAPSVDSVGDGDVQRRVYASLTVNTQAYARTFTLVTA